MVAVEFALVVPTLVLLIIGAFDIAKVMILYEQVENAAHTIPVTASNLAVQADFSTSLTVDQVQQALSAMFAEIPWIRSGNETGTRSVTMSSVTFIQTVPTCLPSATVACAAKPNVAWSVSYNRTWSGSPTDPNAAGFTNVVRACGVLNQTLPTAGSVADLTSLRTASVVNPTPILVVDVHYRYTPVFFNFVTGPVDLWASSYWPVRSAASNTAVSQQYTKYDIANKLLGAGKCAGFS